MKQDRWRQDSGEEVYLKIGQRPEEGESANDG